MNEVLLYPCTTVVGYTPCTSEWSTHLYSTFRNFALRAQHSPTTYVRGGHSHWSPCPWTRQIGLAGTVCAECRLCPCPQIFSCTSTLYATSMRATRSHQASYSSPDFSTLSADPAIRASKENRFCAHLRKCCLSQRSRRSASVRHLLTGWRRRQGSTTPPALTFLASSFLRRVAVRSPDPCKPWSRV